jgi:hypothetical protein
MDALFVSQEFVMHVTVCMQLFLEVQHIDHKYSYHLEFQALDGSVWPLHEVER